MTDDYQQHLNKSIEHLNKALDALETYLELDDSEEDVIFIADEIGTIIESIREIE